MKKRLITALLLVLSVIVGYADDFKRPQMETYNYQRASELMDENKLEDAYTCVQQELASDPKNGYAYLLLGRMYYKNSDYGEALSNFDKALKYIPKKDKNYAALTHAWKALIYKIIDEYDKAFAEYTAAIKITPKDVDYYDNRGELYYDLKDYSSAEADYKKIMELEPANTLGYMGLGRNMIAMEKYAEAIPYFDYAIKLDSSFGQAYAFRAQCYIALKDWNKATDDLISALESNNSKAFSLMQELTGEAFDTFSAKLRLKSIKEPNDALWHYDNGVIHEHCEKYGKAIEYYKKAMDVDAHSIYAERIATCYNSINEYAEALKWVDKAIELNPEDADLNYLKSRIKYESGNAEEAIAEIEKYIKKNPEYFGGYYQKGFYEDNSGKTDDAIEDYSLAIALEPDYAYSYLGRADMYMLINRTEEARADYRKVIELDTIPGNNSCAQYAYQALGERDKAIAFMDSIISQDKDYAGNYYDAACLAARMGDVEKSLAYLTTAFEKGYRRIAHIMADDDMAPVRETVAFKELLEKYSTKSEDPTTEVKEVVKECVTVPFTKENGIYKVKCSINDLPLHFYFDTGASDVTLSMVEANFMFKNGYLKSSDIVGSTIYSDANGELSEGTVINIAHVNFGGLELKNVKASIVRNQKAPLLLGQSVLSRLGKIEIDYKQQCLIITHETEK